MVARDRAPLEGTLPRGRGKVRAAARGRGRQQDDPDRPAEHRKPPALARNLERVTADVVVAPGGRERGGFEERVEGPLVARLVFTSAVEPDRARHRRVMGAAPARKGSIDTARSEQGTAR
jgi:hypothetical protein